MELIAEPLAGLDISLDKIQEGNFSSLWVQLDTLNQGRIEIKAEVSIEEHTLVDYGASLGIDPAKTMELYQVFRDLFLSEANHESCIQASEVEERINTLYGEIADLEQSKQRSADGVVAAQIENKWNELRKLQKEEASRIKTIFERTHLSKLRDAEHSLIKAQELLQHGD